MDQPSPPQWGRKEKSGPIFGWVVPFPNPKFGLFFLKFNALEWKRIRRRIIIGFQIRIWKKNNNGS